jgi:hypothetical protein
MTKVNEGESNTPCPSTLEGTYSSGSGLEITKVNEGSRIHLALAHWKGHTPQVEKLSEALKQSYIVNVV